MALTWSLTDAPAGFTINSATGLVSCPALPSPPATIDFTVQVTNGETSDSLTVYIVVTADGGGTPTTYITYAPVGLDPVGLTPVP